MLMFEVMGWSGVQTIPLSYIIVSTTGSATILGYFREIGRYLAPT